MSLGWFAVCDHHTPEWVDGPYVDEPSAQASANDHNNRVHNGQPFAEVIEQPDNPPEPEPTEPPAPEPEPPAPEPEPHEPDEDHEEDHDEGGHDDGGTFSAKPESGIRSAELKNRLRPSAEMLLTQREDRIRRRK